MAGHDQRHQCSTESRGGHGPAASVLEAVEDRADHGRNHRERRHRDQQVEQYVAAFRARRCSEKDRAGECNCDHGVGAVAEHLVPDQRGEAGLFCTVCFAGIDHLAGDPAGRATCLASGPANRPRPYRPALLRTRGAGRALLGGPLGGASAVVGRPAVLLPDSSGSATGPSCRTRPPRDRQQLTT